MTSDVCACGAVVTSLHWKWHICNPGLPFGSKIRSCAYINFRFSWKGFFVILILYVFTLTSLRSRSRPKKCHYFSILLNIKQKLIFLSVFIAMIIIFDLNINIRSTVVKQNVYQSMLIVNFKELTCQNSNVLIEV